MCFSYLSLDYSSTNLIDILSHIYDEKVVFSDSLCNAFTFLYWLGNLSLIHALPLTASTVVLVTL